MLSQDPVLSICVPTFNRVDMLQRNVSFHLDAFRARGLPFEIVVVDDCSTDGTAEYLAGLSGDPEVKAYRRDKNAGFLDNFAFAMRRASGRYALFLGDDDLLIPEKVHEYIERLDADPRLGMIQAPWLCIDERPGAKPIGPFYKIPGEARFAQGAFAPLMNFIFDYHVFPEFMIIRRDVLARSISSPCPFIFWAFLFVARALAQADILFIPEPFARVTAVSDDPRMQQGHKELMFQWDHYRGGVEYLVSLANTGALLPLEQRNTTTAQINRFMLTRERIALHLHILAHNWVEAYILYHRMAAYEPVPIAPSQFKQICQMAGIVTAVAEATKYRQTPVAVDPMIKDDLLIVLKPELRERLVRLEDVERSGHARPNAYLRINPAFPPVRSAGDAMFDLSEYMAQFI